MGNISTLLYDTGKWVGLIGFVSLSFLIFSGDMARFFDRFFGLDKIIKFQRKFSLITALFVLSHPIFFILSSHSILPYIIPDFTIIPLALGIVSLYFFVLVMIASSLYKRISYQIWQYIHVLTYLLFFFSLYHAVNWGSDSNKTHIKILYGFLLVAVIVGIIYRTQYKIRKKYAGKFYVKEIKRETNDVFTLILTPEKKFPFKAGQFCFLRLNKEKIYARHPFTISSSPQESDLCFTIKLQGRFTKTVLNLKNGEEVIVDGPFGIFTERNTTKNFVFIAGGVGITPFWSMIKDNLHKDKPKNILLLYGSKTEADIIFKKELDNIKEGWFKKVYFLSKENRSSELYEKGHINKTMIEKYVQDIDNNIFYICGPEMMKNDVKKALINLGVKKRDIIIEDFFW